MAFSVTSSQQFYRNSDLYSQHDTMNVLPSLKSPRDVLALGAMVDVLMSGGGCQEAAYTCNDVRNGHTEWSLDGDFTISTIATSYKTASTAVRRKSHAVKALSWDDETLETIIGTTTATQVKQDSSLLENEDNHTVQIENEFSVQEEVSEHSQGRTSPLSETTSVSDTQLDNCTAVVMEGFSTEVDGIPKSDFGTNEQIDSLDDDSENTEQELVESGILPEKPNFQLSDESRIRTDTLPGDVAVETYVIDKIPQENSFRATQKPTLLPDEQSHFNEALVLAEIRREVLLPRRCDSVGAHNNNIVEALEVHEEDVKTMEETQKISNTRRSTNLDREQPTILVPNILEPTSCESLHPKLELEIVNDSENEKVVERAGQSVIVKDIRRELEDEFSLTSSEDEDVGVEIDVTEFWAGLISQSDHDAHVSDVNLSDPSLEPKLPDCAEAILKDLRNQDNQHRAEIHKAINKGKGFQYSNSYRKGQLGPSGVNNEMNHLELSRSAKTKKRGMLGRFKKQLASSFRSKPRRPGQDFGQCRNSAKGASTTTNCLDTSSDTISSVSTPRRVGIPGMRDSPQFRAQSTRKVVENMAFAPEESTSS